MTSHRFFLIAAALGLAAGTPATAQRAPPDPPVSSKPATPPSKPAPADTSASFPPIVFFVAKGDANACGVGCSEWIAADGRFDAGADDRLRALLKKLGGRKLPIFFDSPGGSGPAGLAVGRLMRQSGLTAGVGWTVPAGCDPKQRREPACDKLKRSGRDLVAVLDLGHTMCNSACVFALVGAAVREVGAGVQLGVHSASIAFTLKRSDGHGHVTTMPTQVAPNVERKALENGYATISAYLREMGISQDLLAASRTVEFSQLRPLTRDELVAFGIDRRETVEGVWLSVDQTGGPSALKVIEEKRAGAFHKDFLNLTCRNASTLRLLYGRDAEPNAAGWAFAVRLRVTARGGSFLFAAPYKTAASGGRGPMDIRSVDLPISVLGDAAFTIEADDTAALIVGGVPGNSSISKVMVQSTGPGLGELLRRCGNDLPTTKRVPTERI
jgi:hypothetical protein